MYCTLGEERVHLEICPKALDCTGSVLWRVFGREGLSFRWEWTWLWMLFLRGWLAPSLPHPFQQAVKQTVLVQSFWKVSFPSPPGTLQPGLDCRGSSSAFQWHGAEELVSARCGLSCFHLTFSSVCKRSRIIECLIFVGLYRRVFSKLLVFSLLCLLLPVNRGGPELGGGSGRWPCPEIPGAVCPVLSDYTVVE